MKPAILYTLRSTEIVCGDYHQMARSNLRPVFTTNPNEAIAPMVDRFAVPIHRVTRCAKPHTMPLDIEPWHHEDYEDVFFALEPALAEIIEAPFAAKVEEAQRREQAATNLLYMAETSMERFNSQPWYKRGWAAIRHGITF